MDDVISCQEAIEILRANYPDACYEQLRKAVDAAIEALETQDRQAIIAGSYLLESEDNVPDTNVGDTISRNDAIDALRVDISIIPFAKAREYVRVAIDTIYNRLEELPSAHPDRSLWFRIGEICVDESKGFISSGRAVEKIRELLRAERRVE